MLDFTPKSTEEMVFANADTKSILSDILLGNISFPSNGKNSLLLYGVFGSGKTTYANIFFNEYDKSFQNEDTAFANPFGSVSIVNIAVDGNEKITTTVDKLTEMCQFIPFNASNKHYILFDEVDGYSIKQQRRLKSWLNRSDVICVMTTNYIEDIDTGLRSRCYEVEFNASSNISDYVMRLRQILHQHNMPLLNETQLYQIVQRADGDWREMCATLQRVCANISTQPQQPKGLRVV